MRETLIKITTEDIWIIEFVGDESTVRRRLKHNQVSSYSLRRLLSMGAYGTGVMISRRSPHIPGMTQHETRDTKCTQ